jgi:aspartate aminotransferase
MASIVRHLAYVYTRLLGDESSYDVVSINILARMTGRIKTVRSLLYDDLVKLNPDKDWTFVKRQIGMFSFTGLNPAQVENMTAKHAIYMTKVGRQQMS